MPTMRCGSATNVADVPIDDLQPNGYNPNRMSPGMLDVLAKTIRKDGFLGVILVKRTARGLVIIDGEHRWRAARQLGMRSVPCFTVSVPEDRARALTLKLNQIHGCWNGVDLIEVLRGLPDPLEDLGFSEYQHKKQLEELAAKDALRKVVDEIERQIETTMAESAAESELYVGFLLNAEQRQLLEQALESAAREGKGKSLTRTESLEMILRRFLASGRPQSRLGKSLARGRRFR